MTAQPSNVVAHAPPLPNDSALSAEHREHLRKSGLTDVTIAAARVYSEADGKRVAELINWKAWRHGPVLVLPFFEPGKADPVMYRVRPDKPRSRMDKGKAKLVKYEQPSDVRVQPYFPPNTRRGGWLQDATRPLLWTEGEKKALLLDQLGYATIGGTGITCFHQHREDKENDPYVIHAKTREHVALAGRVHVIVFDSDAAEKPQIMHAAKRLAGMLEATGAARVLFVRIPVEGDAKLGIDDYYVAHGEAATKALLAAGTPIAGLPPEEPFTALKSVPGLDGAPVGPGLRMPYGYEVHAKGTIWKTAEQEGKEDTLVCDDAILIRRIVLDLYTGEERVELTFKRFGEWKTLLVDRRAVRDSRGIVASLAGFGPQVDTGNAAEVVRWLAKFDHVNQARLTRTTCVPRCGWHQHEGVWKFVAPGLLTDEALIFDERGSGGATTAGLRVAGSPEAQLEALTAIANEETAAATAIFAALATPLLRRFGLDGFAVHLFGDSSRGKSTMLRGAASIYGDPRHSSWVASWNTTQVGLEMRAHALSDLPCCIDEAGVADERMRTAAVYMLANGVGRSRGAKAGGLRDTPEWRTIVISTGELDLVAEDANTGAQVRVLRRRVQGVGRWGAPEVTNFNATVSENYGHLGQRWLGALSTMDDEDLAAYAKVVKKLAAEIAGTGSNLRARQATYLALLIFTERLAHHLVGFGTSDGRLCSAVTLDAEEEHAVESAAERARADIADWIAGRLHMSFARVVEDGVRDGHIRGELCGYYRADRRPDRTDFLWVIPGALKAALTERGHQWRAIRNEWAERGWIVDHDPGRGDRNRHIPGAGQTKRRLVSLSPEAFGEVPKINGHFIDA